MTYKCIDNTFDGKGVFIIDGKKVFVNGILKDEEVELEKKKHYVLKKVVKPSPKRIKVECPYFLECGGCQYLNIDYEEEIKIKETYLKQLFNNEIKLTKLANPYNYRNKVQYTFNTSKTNNLTLGLFKERTNELFTVNNCLLHHKRIEEAAYKVLEILKKYKLKAYDKDTRKGILRHMLFRYSNYKDELLLCFVLGSEILPKRKEIIKEIVNLNLKITTIIENYNFRNTPIVLGEKSKVIYGSGYILDKIVDKVFLVGESTFYQINSEGVKTLYSKAIEMAKLKKNQVLVDAYSGVGTIGLICADKVKEVISIEINKESVKAAINNAKLNKINNVKFIAGDATVKLAEYAKTNLKVDCLIMDPPREGSTYKFIKTINDLKVKKVIYISCNPETLKRDLDIFQTLNYKIEHMEAVDMFARTANIETICVLSLK